MMTEEHDNTIRYDPLKNLLHALETVEHESREALEASMEARGFKPTDITKSIRAAVDAGLREQRLSWRHEGETKREKLQELRRKAQTWAQRSVEDIEAAFGQVVQGAFGTLAQGKVQAAFRNLDKVSLEDKASFLDDLALIDAVDEEGVADDEQ